MLEAMRPLEERRAASCWMSNLYSSAGHYRVSWTAIMGYVMTITVVCALWAVEVASRRIPLDDKNIHHSTKKELKDPNRFPRKIQNVDSSDLDPALAYALPPVGLLHRGQGFGFGVGQGYESAPLAALVSSGLQENLQQPKTPVYHATPLEPYGALLNHLAATPIEEPKQEDHAVQTAQAVQAQAHNFIQAPKYYKQEQYEDEVS
ncbi:hypothetical protein J6590_027586 [Homalodisca vitripennis]|nr:hypothetical protein J6590_027586 [Homalodisca vitripennis]